MDGKYYKRRKRSKIGTFSKISLITNVIIKSFPQVINILWKTLLYSYQEILKMSVYADYWIVKNLLKAFFIELVYIKINTVIIKFFLTL